MRILRCPIHFGQLMYARPAIETRVEEVRYEKGHQLAIMGGNKSMDRLISMIASPGVRTFVAPQHPREKEHRVSFPTWCSRPMSLLSEQMCTVRSPCGLKHRVRWCFLLGAIRCCLEVTGSTYGEQGTPRPQLMKAKI